MRHNDIRIGDGLKLKGDNPYGMPPLVMEVTDITYKPGYKTPWVHTELGTFRPSDFSGKRDIVTAHAAAWKGAV